MQAPVGSAYLGSAVLHSRFPDDTTTRRMGPASSPALGVGRTDTYRSFPAGRDPLEGAVLPEQDDLLPDLPRESSGQIFDLIDRGDRLGVVHILGVQGADLRDQG